MARDELIIEFVPIGNSVKVTVMDAATLTEVSIVGPRNASKHDLQQAAIQKLKYVMAQKSGAKDAEKQTLPPRKGIIV
jgi:uncharacterized protein DUF6898